jgi:hypothetical protein
VKGTALVTVATEGAARAVKVRIVEPSKKLNPFLATLRNLVILDYIWKAEWGSRPDWYDEV